MNLPNIKSSPSPTGRTWIWYAQINSKSMSSIGLNFLFFLSPQLIVNNCVFLFSLKMWCFPWNSKEIALLILDQSLINNTSKKSRIRVTLVNTMNPCQYHESLSIPLVLVNIMSPCLYHKSLSIPRVDFSQISFVCLITWFAWAGLIRLKGLPDIRHAWFWSDSCLIDPAATWFWSGMCLIDQAAAWFWSGSSLIDQAAAWFWSGMCLINQA